MVPQTESATTSTNADVPGRRRARHLLALLAPLLIAASAAVVTGCAGTEVPAVPAGDAPLVLGREIYSSNCVGCHGADGGGGTGSKLNDGVVAAAYPDLAGLVTVIAEGKGRMPAYGGRLSAEELDAVARFTLEGL